MVGAVAALGLAAAFDALRGEDEHEPAAKVETWTGTTQAEPAGRTLVEAATELREAGVPVGVLTYADELCRVRSVTLPDLDAHPGAESRTCQFRSTIGNEFAFGDSPRSPYGRLGTRCRRGWIELRMPNGGLYARAHGRCPAAWRWDRAPTFLHNGEVLQFAPCPDDDLGVLPIRCTRTLLSRGDLARELRRARWTALDFMVEEVYWLDDRRFAAIVQARSPDGGADMLAIFENGRLVSDPPFAYSDLDGIRPSPSGDLVSARIRDDGGIATVDRDGESVRLAMRHGDAVTWSPDQEWIAEATADGIYVFRADDDSPQFIQIPIVALDLVWR